MSEIARWLEGLGLGHFASTFTDAAIDLDILAEITERDLEKLGIPLGDRKRLVKAIAALSELALPFEPEASAAECAATWSAVSPLRADAECRQLAVMIVDLVGSTALSARLDSEEMREVIRGYQNVVAGEMVRFEGNVARFMGDGVLAYFGWATAHEDDLVLDKDINPNSIDFVVTNV